MISQQAGQEPIKISDINTQELEEDLQVAESENENEEMDNPEIENTSEEFMNELSEDIPESKDDTIAVMMSVSNVTPSGLTVHFRQYDKRENMKLREKRFLKTMMKSTLI